MLPYAVTNLTWIVGRMTLTQRGGIKASFMADTDPPPHVLLHFYERFIESQFVDQHHVALTATASLFPVDLAQ